MMESGLYYFLCILGTKIQKIRPKSCTQPQSQHQLEEPRIENNSVNMLEKGCAHSRIFIYFMAADKAR